MAKPPERACPGRVSQPGTTPPFMQTPAWEEFLNSLPKELPSLGQAAEVYDHILAELKPFQEKLKDR